MKKLFLLISILFSIASLAGAQNFNTGSDYMNTGSTLSSTIYDVGATSVVSTPAAAPAGNRGRTLGGVTEDDDERSEQSPIGAPYIMLLFAAAAAGVIATRRHKA